jgi:hypothetical protein
VFAEWSRSTISTSAAAERWAKYKALALTPEETNLFSTYDENLQPGTNLARDRRGP